MVTMADRQQTEPIKPSYSRFSTEEEWPTTQHYEY